MMCTKYIPLTLLAGLIWALTGCAGNEDVTDKIKDVLREQTLQTAAWALTQEPLTVTAEVCERSSGGIHDFYSEGDYWWPDPTNPEGPYIRRDGETNPENFVAHRHLMIRFSQIVGSLTQAWLMTGEEQYVTHAFKHIHAWFVNPETKMNPSLLYAQAIKGITPGRGIGIIDTIHLMEVAQGIYRIQHDPHVDPETLKQTKKWFSEYLHWLRNHPNSLDEMNAKNNHGTCWVMQVASFAKLVNDRQTLEFCRLRYKNVLLPNQMGSDGSFPREMSRTKPYGYALFNLDAMATVCQILSTEEENLWDYTTEEGLNMKKGIEFMYPYIKDKSSWTLTPDVMYWDEWPVAQPALIFGSVACNNSAWFELWKNLEHDPKVDEVIRNLPIRNPLIWL